MFFIGYLYQQQLQQEFLIIYFWAKTKIIYCVTCTQFIKEPFGVFFLQGFFHLILVLISEYCFELINYEEKIFVR